MSFLNFYILFRLSTSDADGGLGTSLVSWLPPFIQIKHSEETNKIEIVEFKPVRDFFIIVESMVGLLLSGLIHCILCTFSMIRISLKRLKNIEILRNFGGLLVTAMASEQKCFYNLTEGILLYFNVFGFA